MKNKKIIYNIISVLLFVFISIGCTSTDTPVINTDIPITEENQNETVITENSENNTSKVGVKEEKENNENKENEESYIPKIKKPSVDLNSIPKYNGLAYITVNNNIPYFSENDFSKISFEKYSPLDSLGRCGVAFANIGKDIMPLEERGTIGQVKPTGWQTVKYDFIDGKYLYNRCHLIGYQLSGENANNKNLITGTRYLNIEGMLPFENMVADYVKETNNHVLYRVTPMFEGNNLLSSGVLIEALSMEDNGEGICFNVFCYNVQPGVKIDYSTGENSAEEAKNEKTAPPVAVVPVQPENNVVSEIPVSSSYIGNKNTKKFHHPSCSSVKKMKESNKDYLNCTRDEVINKGYVPCKNCNP